MASDNTSTSRLQCIEARRAQDAAQQMTMATQNYQTLEKKVDILDQLCRAHMNQSAETTLRLIAADTRIMELEAENAQLRDELDRSHYVCSLLEAARSS